MKKGIALLGCFMLSIVLCGCTAYSNRQVPKIEKINYSVNTEKSSYSDATLDVSISPSIDALGNYRSFILGVVNKSKNDIKLSWNESYFLESGEARGGFMFEGVKYTDRENHKKDDLILANSTYTKQIYPNSKVIYVRGWYHEALFNAEYGAYLIFEGDRYKKTIRVFTTITRD